MTKIKTGEEDLENEFENEDITEFYTDVDRDEMLIYVNYLGTIVYFLTHMNLDAVLQREHNLKVSSYKKL